MPLPLLALLATSSFASTSLPPGPVLPAGCAPEFHAAVFAVQQNLEQGDFTAAEAGLKRLPVATFGIAWNDDKVPAARRVAFRSARDKAIATWRQSVPGVGADGANSEIQIAFQPQLAAEVESEGPKDVVMIASEAAPSLSALVGLRRGAPPVDANEADVYNAVLSTVGTYLGVGRGVLPGTAMAATPGSPALLSPIERYVAVENLKVVATLREAVSNKTRLKASRPALNTTPAGFEGEALQGDRLDLEIQVTNKGDGPLSYSAIGDCACVVTTRPGQIAAGESATVRAVFDTREYTGDVSRKLVLYTNDPTDPIRLFPVRVKIAPRYRFLSKAGSSAFTLGEKDRTLEFFLVPNPEAPFKVRELRLNGLEGKVSFAEWSGEMADPEMNETARPRTGYRVRVELPGEMPPGRVPMSLIALTDTPELSVVQHPFTVQRGMVVSPEELFLGELGAQPSKAYFLLSQPGRPFRILSAKADSTLLAVKAVAGKQPWEHRIDVEYVGGAKAPKGDLVATVTVTTDDPKRPKVMVLVTGNVR